MKKNNTLSNQVVGVHRGNMNRISNKKTIIVCDRIGVCVLWKICCQRATSLMFNLFNAMSFFLWLRLCILCADEYRRPSESVHLFSIAWSYCIVRIQFCPLDQEKKHRPTQCNRQAERKRRTCVLLEFRQMHIALNTIDRNVSKRSSCALCDCV